jgi:quaternary ammonium compound-resistance protein SugE
MAWLTLVVAGLFETGFAVALKMSHGMTRLWPTAIFAACALLSFALLTMALRHLEVGPAYAVWTGIGAAGTAVIGMAFLGDTVSTLKLVSISLILAGVVGLNLSGVTPLRRRTGRWHSRRSGSPGGDPARADSSHSGTTRTSP